MPICAASSQLRGNERDGISNHPIALQISLGKERDRDRKVFQSRRGFKLPHHLRRRQEEAEEDAKEMNNITIDEQPALLLHGCYSKCLNSSKSRVISWVYTGSELRIVWTIKTMSCSIWYPTHTGLSCGGVCQNFY